MTPEIRVAMLIQRYLPHVGGAERQLASLCPLLAAQGVTVQVVTRMHVPLPPNEIIDGVPVCRIRTPGPKVISSFLFSLRSQAVLRRFRPDVLHAHELLSPSTTALLAKTFLGKPVLAKPLRGGTLGDIAKLKSRRSGALRIRSLRRSVDAFVAISDEIDAELRELGIPDRSIHRIPNGVDTDRFQPVTPDRKTGLRRELNLDGDPLVVFSGRLAPEKGVDILLAAWADLLREIPRAGLVVLGDGPEHDSLTRLAGERVRFVGPVDDVAPYLQAADIFVLPSLTEGLSNSLLEAMASGLAVVATSVGGARDIIIQEQNGFIAEPGKAQNLLHAILVLCRDTELKQRLGVEARRTIVDGYALPTVAARLTELYGEISGLKVP